MFLISRILSTTSIRISQGQATCVKGKMMQQTLRTIGDACEQFNIKEGEIWVSGNGRIRFSSSIAKEAHQRLRNCVAQSPYN